MTDTNPFGSGVIRRQVAAPEEVKAGALSVGAVVPAEELQLHDLMFRTSARDFPGAGEVLFEEDNADEWYRPPAVYGQKLAGRMSQAEHWQKIMSWPRLPTFDEALQWQQSATAESYNALADALAVVRQDWAEAEALAALGDDVFWREAMPKALPGTRDVNAPLSCYQVAFWLSTDTNRTAWPGWRKQLVEMQGEIEARRIAAAAKGVPVPGPVA
jgi:hypothetical protein